MFGISIGTAASLAGAAGSLAGGVAGAMGSGGGQLSKTQQAYNDWAAANQFNLQNKQNKWLKTANNVAKDPANWAPYAGPTVAEFNPFQTTAFQQTYDAATNDQNLANAQSQVNRTIGGDYLNYKTPANQYMGQGPSTANSFIGSFADYANPWEGKQPTEKNAYMGATNKYEGAQNDYRGLTNQYVGAENDYKGLTNQYTGAQTNVVNNPLLGMNNPYLSNAINYAAGDTIRNYQKAVTPSTDAAFARAGAFGGSAWGEQTAENQRNLANVLGQQATNARMGDFTNQQNLMNSNAQFQTNINQADLARNAGLASSDLARNAGLTSEDLARNAGLVNTDLARNAGISSEDLSRNSNIFSTDLARNSSLAEGDLNRQMDAWKFNAILNENAAKLNQGTWQSNLGAQQSQNELSNNQWATNANLAQTQLNNTLQNYMRERGYQQDSIGQSLALQNQRYTDANNLLQAGNQQQQQNQNQLNAAMQYYYGLQNAQRAPVDWMLGNYNTAIGNASQPTMTPNTKTNPYMGALGGAIGGYQLGSGLFNAMGNGGGYSYNGSFSGLPMFQ